MGAIDQLGMQLGSSVIGAGMGLALADTNDRRQLNMQQQLTDMQVKAQEQLTEYNREQQLQMWHDTNYGAQVQEMNKAGINPALLYGMGGGGGVTANVSTGSVSGGQAPQGGHEAQEMSGMALQSAMNLKLMGAQEKVLETQAEKNQAEADKTKGVDTDVAANQANLLAQGYDNARQDHEIKKLQITYDNIRNFEAQATQQNRMQYIELQAKEAAQLLRSLNANANVDVATQQAKIDTIRTQAIGAVLQNVLTQSNVAKTNMETLVQSKLFDKLANDIAISWENISNDRKELDIQNQIKEYTTDPNREAIQEAVGAITSILHALPTKSTTVIDNPQGKTIIRNQTVH